MRAWIGAALVASALTLAAPAALAAANGAAEAKAATTRSVYFGARRVQRYPAYPVPAYYARPYYYRPYPYGVPVPFFLGFGYLPSY
jgi:hypothetical protein